MNLVLLDYDGYVAKSYYAGFNTENPGDIQECVKCMLSMETYAIRKAKEFFNSDDIAIIKVVSGHTVKKDLYPSYKRGRKKDVGLQKYREMVKGWDDVIIAEHIEADDLLVLLNEYLREESVVFSDDKDLHKYCKYTCKLNEIDQINTKQYSKQEQVIQLVTGDSIDHIAGIPNIGEHKAKKWFKGKEYNLDNAIRMYKEFNVSADDCLKNILLVHPFAKGLIGDLNPSEDYLGIFYDILIEGKYNSREVMSLIFDVMNRLSKKVKEIYYEENK